MLLASFHGMVHEIMPAFVNTPGQTIPPDFETDSHLLPTLFTADSLTHGTGLVKRSFQDRNLNIVVLENDTGKKLDYFVQRLKTLK